MSRPTIHRAQLRDELVNPQEQQHKRAFNRLVREAPLRLCQLDLVGGIYLADGRESTMLTGIDDHSCFCRHDVVKRPSSTVVCEAFIAELARWGVPIDVVTNTPRLSKDVLRLLKSLSGMAGQAGRLWGSIAARASMTLQLPGTRRLPEPGTQEGR